MGDVRARRGEALEERLSRSGPLPPAPRDRREVRRGGARLIRLSADGLEQPRGQLAAAGPLERTRGEALGEGEQVVVVPVQRHLGGEREDAVPRARPEQREVAALQEHHRRRRHRRETPPRTRPRLAALLAALARALRSDAQAALPAPHHRPSGEGALCLPAEEVLHVDWLCALVDRALEHRLYGLLLEGVVLRAHHLAQPVGVAHARHRVGDALQSGGDRDNLLDGDVEPLPVVAPVDDRADVDLLRAQGAVLEPLSEEVHLDRRLGVEDGDRDGALGDWLLRRPVGDDELAREAGVGDHLLAQELGEAAGDGDRGRLLGAVLVKRLGHRLLLREELEDLVIVEVDALRVDDVKPAVRHLCHRRVALLERRPLEESALVEDLRLEDLEQLQLPAPLHLEALELGEVAVELEDGVPLLEQPPLLRRRGQDHGLVGAVHLELDRHLPLLVVGASLGVERLVLRVVVVAVDVDVEHDARVRDGNLRLLGAPRRGDDVLREAGGQHAPDAVRV
mmetsp:Transcript_29423/g.89314  ORF Transcript_29423/g.89314 Transcript_29423/m.89314 type:complete len:510 (+) Transcript_29423:476-2005(+)